MIVVNALLESLVSLRKKRKLTQAQIAAKMKLPQSHISLIEQGRVDPRLSTVSEFAFYVDAVPVLIPRERLLEVLAILRESSKPGRLIEIIEE